MRIIASVEVRAKCRKYDIKSGKYELVLRICNGTLIAATDKYYIMTCYHAIKNYESIKVIYENKKYLVKEFYSIKAYDFSILTFHDISLNAGKYKFKIKMEAEIKDPIFIDHKGQLINCKYRGYSVAKVKSELFPGIPIINLVIDKYLPGISGTLPFVTNKVLGMVSFYDTDSYTVSVVPSYCLKLFFRMALLKGGVKTFCMKTAVCNYNETSYGHIVKDSYRIKYKTRDSNFMFNTNDVIEQVNGNRFDQKGNLLVNNVMVPLESYIVLTNNDFYKLDYLAYKGKEGEYEKKSVEVAPVLIEPHLKFNIEHRCVNYKGLMIAEMSEELLVHCHMRGIRSKLINEHYDNCYTNTKDKLIVVLQSSNLGIITKINDKKANFNILSKCDAVKLHVQDSANRIRIINFV